MNEDLKNLIAARGPEFAKQKMDAEAREAADVRDRKARSDKRRAEEVAVAQEIFDWFASSAGQALLTTMRDAKLDRAVVSVVPDGETAIWSDGRIELHRRFRMGGMRKTFANAAAYGSFARELCGDYHGGSPPLNEPLLALADYMRDGTIFDKLAEHLRKVP